MHPVKHEGHRQQIPILERNHLPLILGSWPISVDLSQETEREDNDSHPDPDCDCYKIA